MRADGAVRYHQVLDRRVRIDAHALDLLGELTVGIGDRRAARKRTCLCITHRMRRRDAKPLGADVAAVPLRRRRTRAGGADDERKHERCKCEGFYNVHKYSSLISVYIEYLK